MRLCGVAPQALQTLCADKSLAPFQRGPGMPQTSWSSEPRGTRQTRSPRTTGPPASTPRCTHGPGMRRRRAPIGRTRPRSALTGGVGGTHPTDRLALLPVRTARHVSSTSPVPSMSPQSTRRSHLFSASAWVGCVGPAIPVGAPAPPRRLVRHMRGPKEALLRSRRPSHHFGFHRPENSCVTPLRMYRMVRRTTNFA